MKIAGTFLPSTVSFKNLSSVELSFKLGDDILNCDTMVDVEEGYRLPLIPYGYDPWGLLDAPDNAVDRICRHFR